MVYVGVISGEREMGPFLIAFAAGAWCGRYVSVAIFAMVSFVALADICITLSLSGASLSFVLLYAVGLIICTQAGYLFGAFTGHWKISRFHLVRRQSVSESAGLDRATLPK